MWKADLEMPEITSSFSRDRLFISSKHRHGYILLIEIFAFKLDTRINGNLYHRFLIRLTQEAGGPGKQEAQKPGS